jgi:hypothetical protein
LGWLASLEHVGQGPAEEPLKTTDELFVAQRSSGYLALTNIRKDALVLPCTPKEVIDSQTSFAKWAREDAQHCLTSRKQGPICITACNTNAWINEMAIKTVRLEPDDEKRLARIRGRTGWTATDVLKRGIRLVEETLASRSTTKAFDVYSTLNLGQGGYARGPASKSRETARMVIRRKNKR